MSEITNDACTWRGTNVMPDPRRNKKGLRLLAQYLHRPRTMEQIKKAFSLGERTAYRWLDYLRESRRVIATREKGVTAYLVTK